MWDFGDGTGRLPASLRHTATGARRHDDGDTDCHERHEADIHHRPGRSQSRRRCRPQLPTSCSLRPIPRSIRTSSSTASGTPSRAALACLFPGRAIPPRGPAIRGTSATEPPCTGPSLTHRYLRGGVMFVVTLRVTSDTGLTAQSSRQLTVSTTLPAGSASFVFSPTDPHTGDEVYFNASASTIADGTFTWDFGDGTTGSGVNTIHVYSRERTYTVSMTVQQRSSGRVATTSKTVTVVEVAAEGRYGRRDRERGTAAFSRTPTIPRSRAGAIEFPGGRAPANRRHHRRFQRGRHHRPNGPPPDSAGHLRPPYRRRFY